MCNFEGSGSECSNALAYFVPKTVMERSEGECEDISLVRHVSDLKECEDLRAPPRPEGETLMHHLRFDYLLRFNDLDEPRWMHQ